MTDPLKKLRKRILDFGRAWFPSWTCRCQLRKLAAVYRRLIKEVGDDKKHRDNLIAEWQFESEEYLDEIAGIQSRRLVKEAQKELVDVFAVVKDNEWTQGRFGETFLKARALARLNKAVSEAKRAKWEFRLKVISGIAGVLTGLVGSVIGLVAVLKKK
jgi:hypothetical protein